MAIDYSVLALPKGVTRKRAKGRKNRAEKRVKDDVRAECVQRDGNCRLNFFAPWGDHAAIVDDKLHESRECVSKSEWAHMHARRRSQTRGRAPEERHDTAHSLMLCSVHHDQYDGRAKPRLLITALTRKGADGPLKFRRAKA